MMELMEMEEAGDAPFCCLAPLNRPRTSSRNDQGLINDPVPNDQAGRISLIL